MEVLAPCDNVYIDRLISFSWLISPLAGLAIVQDILIAVYSEHYSQSFQLDAKHAREKNTC